jgi:hypothetical protein
LIISAVLWLPTKNHPDADQFLIFWDGDKRTEQLSSLLYVEKSTMATPSQVIDTIKQLTKTSHAIQKPAQDITIINSVLMQVGQGPYPQIFAGMREVVATTNSSLPAMTDMPPVVAGSDADAIFDAYSEVLLYPSSFLELC